MLEYLQVMIFANLFAITSNPQHVEDVKELVLTLLEDEQLEASFSHFVCSNLVAFQQGPLRISKTTNESQGFSLLS